MLISKTLADEVFENGAILFTNSSIGNLLPPISLSD